MHHYNTLLSTAGHTYKINSITELDHEQEGMNTYTMIDDDGKPLPCNDGPSETVSIKHVAVVPWWENFVITQI